MTTDSEWRWINISKAHQAGLLQCKWTETCHEECGAVTWAYEECSLWEWQLERRPIFFFFCHFCKHFLCLSVVFPREAKQIWRGKTNNTPLHTHTKRVLVDARFLLLHVFNILHLKSSFTRQQEKLWCLIWNHQLSAGTSYFHIFLNLNLLI